MQAHQCNTTVTSWSPDSEFLVQFCPGLQCLCSLSPTAYWDATRAFMILSLLACFIGIVIGVMAFIHYSSFDGFDKTFAAGILFFISCELLICSPTQYTSLSQTLKTLITSVLISCAGFFVLLAMAVYTGVTVNYYGKRYGSWRFSWSYIMGWVAVVLTFFSGMHLIMSINRYTLFSCSSS